MISIIIPVFNAEKFILKCLESILKQTFINYEVILVNDGSTDSSEEIIRSFIEEKYNWTLVSKVNEGVAVARNLGLEKSRGNYITFIDADDFVEANYLEKLYNSFSINNCNLSCCGYYDHSFYGVSKLNNYKSYSDKTIEVDEFIKLLFSQIGGVLWDKMFDARIIKENKIQMNLEVYFYEDSIFVLDYLNYTDKIRIIDEPLYNYNRINEISFTSKIDYSWKENVKNYNQILPVKLRLLKCDEITIKSIVVKNIWNYIFTIFLYKLGDYSFTKQYTIVKDMVTDSYFKVNYLSESKRNIEKPFRLFYKYQMVTSIIVYAFILRCTKVLLNGIKTKLKRR
jgi:glycosyltransferase involved in cell wall biosynthesis